MMQLMNVRRISIGLLLFNLCLLAALGYLIYLLRFNPAQPVGATTKIVTNTVRQVAVRRINNPWLESLAGRPANWGALESTNYAVFIANLRAFGCPEETVRDIILSEVSKLYAKRRTALRAQLSRIEMDRFWITDASHATQSGDSLRAGLMEQLDELDKEQAALIRELLGVDFRSEMAKYWSEDNEQERRYSFLPVEKQGPLRDVLGKFEVMEQALYERTKGLLLDQDEAQILQIQRQRQAELAKLLTPEELEEYELRHSSTAAGLRSQLTGFQPTEDEFRKVFRLQKTFAENFSEAFDPTDDAQMQIKQRAQQNAQEAVQDEIRNALGEKRFAEYERAQDGDYKTLVQFAERFEIPRDMADKVYGMKQEAEKQQQRLLQNPLLTPEQRQAAMSAIVRETERAVAGTMGDQLFKNYRRVGGQWIDNLSPPPPPEVFETEPSQ